MCVPTIYFVREKVNCIHKSGLNINNLGTEVTDSNGLYELLDIKNVKVINVRNPEPGMWRLRVDSGSAHTLRLTGLSKIDFAVGFSKDKALHITSTELRPLEGRCCVAHSGIQLFLLLFLLFYTPVL